MQNLPSYLNLWTRFILTSVGILYMIGLPIIFGYKESYSRYYIECPLLYVAVFNILAIGLFIHKNKEWTYPSLFLVILALFNMHEFPFIHYSAAVGFFISSTYAMWNDKRVSGFGRASLIAYPLLLFDLIWFEAIQVLLVCIFHLVYTLKMMKLKKDKKKIKKKTGSLLYHRHQTRYFLLDILKWIGYYCGVIRRKKHIKTITLKEVERSNSLDKIILEYREGNNGNGGWEIVGKDTVLRSRRSIVLGYIISFIIFLIIGPFLSLILNHKVIQFVCAPRFQRFINIDLSLIREINVTGGGFILKRIIYFILGMFAWITSPLLILNLGAVFLLPEYYDWTSLKESIDKDGYNPQKFGYIMVFLSVDGSAYRYRILDGNHRVKIIRDKYGDDHEIDVMVVKVSKLGFLLYG